MDFLAAASSLVLVGNHVKSLVPTDVFSGVHSLTYVSGSVTEDTGGLLLDSSKSNPIPCLSYTPESLADAINTSLDESSNTILIGDPSEWIMAAALSQYMDSKVLAAAFFVYPVGMAALDSRKELAQLILQLKSKDIPTFLLRNPEGFFEGVEPNLAWFVQQLQEGISMGTHIEYLCGLSQSSTIDSNGR
jgi:hypothetical protein